MTHFVKIKLKSLNFLNLLKVLSPKSIGSKALFLESPGDHSQLTENFETK